MKIGIDARLIEQTGIGRYITHLVSELGRLDTKNSYCLFLRPQEFTSFPLPNARWKKVLVDIPWHSVQEQVVLPGVYYKQKLDLLHIPYFTIPIFYRGTFIVTMHDLTAWRFATGKASRLPFPWYWGKQLGLRAVLEIGLRRASHIIAVSEATKKELLSHIHLDERRVSVIGEGVNAENGKAKRLISEQYFLYVGNAYPHKNLDTLLFSFKAFLQKENSTMKLVLVGREDVFYRNIKSLVHDLGLSEHCRFWGYATDADLVSLYVHATTFVFPSLMEGFGLPALEALVSGTPVICSDIAAFREVIGDLGNFFPPRSVSSLQILLSKGAQGLLRRPTRKEIEMLLGRYRWSDMAAETLRIYETVCG